MSNSADIFPHMAAIHRSLRTTGKQREKAMSAPYDRFINGPISEPVDVLAVVRQMREQLPQGSQDPITFLRKNNPLAERADEAISALVELIEAGRALQEAMDTPERGPFDSLTVKFFHEADARHRAALARVGAAP